jgi:hypothetical protein
MRYNYVTRIAILTISVATATLAMSLLSQPASAICAGSTCADTSPNGAFASNPGSLAGTKIPTNGQPSAVGGDSGASAGNILCGGKPTTVVSRHITCAP